MIKFGLDENPGSNLVQSNFLCSMRLIDLHSHILPGVDDGATDLQVSLDMARAYVADGVGIVACTPHILPGLYHNTGTAIRRAITDLQNALDEASIPLRLVPGADNHIVPDFVSGLARGHLLPLADSAYVLVEPPHHVAPARLEDLFFSIQVAGYVPILTHPERLTWINQNYALIQRTVRSGVWMQITSGSLAGIFGREPQYWAERMLDEGLVHILATDAHDLKRRPPDLSRGYTLAARRVGEDEATRLVKTRPEGILNRMVPNHFANPTGGTRGNAHISGQKDGRPRSAVGDEPGSGGMARRLRRYFR